MLYANELLDIAKNEVSDLENIEIFFLRDLFKAYEWNRISRSDCFLLETLFLNYINITHYGFYLRSKDFFWSA
jgi:hypothetical protein